MTRLIMTQKERFLKRGAAIVAVPCLLLGLTLLLSRCAHPKAESLVRFIDLFDRPNIEASPFLDMGAAALKEAVPHVADYAGNFALLDEGVGPNPYNLKKKIKAGPIEVNALFAPPKSRYRFDVRIPRGAVLEFHYGIRRDEDAAKLGLKAEPRTVRFSVLLSRDGKVETLFEKNTTLEPGQDLTYLSRKVDLSAYADAKAAIYFVTEGNRDALACWFNPRLYVPSLGSRPVILISLDTLRADHLGCYGYARKTSPNIDNLSADSALFLNTFSTSPWTLPAHVSLMTGLNCINHQVTQSDRRMDPSVPTLADKVRLRGFTTVAFTGGGYVSGLYGFSKGFDSYNVRGDILSKTAAAELAEPAMAWIRANRDKNFFMFLHTYQIHNPYFTASPYNEAFLEPGDKLTDINMARYNREWRYKTEPEAWRRNIMALYDAEILYTDAALIKPLVDTLKELGLYDRALIVLTADHGEEFFEHRSWLHTQGVYNEVLKVPLIIKLPRGDHRGQRVARWARLVDVMPTLLDEMGIPGGGSYSDGQSLSGFLTGPPSIEAGDERPFLSEIDADASENHLPRKVALSLGRAKLIWNSDFTREQLAFLTFPPPPFKRYEVYDLDQDPLEQRDVAQAKPELTRKLIGAMKDTYEQKTKAVGKPAAMTDEIREQLKALGYIR
jgi:arylsulfatase A-like enzyme